MKLIVECLAIFGVYVILAVIYGEIRHRFILRRIMKARLNCCGSKDKCRAIKPVLQVKKSTKRKIYRI